MSPNWHKTEIRLSVKPHLLSIQKGTVGRVQTFFGQKACILQILNRGFQVEVLGKSAKKREVFGT